MKKLEGNGLWQSSRMMLFEHRDAILSKQEQKQRQTRPILDEQETERIAEKLSQAYHSGATVQIQVYGEYGNQQVEGSISRIDAQLQRLRIQHMWITLADIVEAAIVSPAEDIEGLVP
ncbi:YolD-like family protein [Paenibacillus sp. F411]|uniref:YolD-like protein n=1 Tax=Paenibacillus algicola TaxID=2565926 RepID=A0A4P8XL56_9BACL|nr:MULTISPECIES: YolD-like family protein [Paenibacillus]MBO2944986.1 YolD-like family protein [Paenibacillus sp. F411]QCT02380.1 YolD-like protein [Paenibacillus algicola]